MAIKAQGDQERFPPLHGAVCTWGPKSWNLPAPTPCPSVGKDSDYTGPECHWGGAYLS